MGPFEVLPGGLYALSVDTGTERVVAWVRATPKQDWAPVAAFGTASLDENRAAAMQACRQHLKQQREKRKRAAHGTG